MSYDLQRKIWERGPRDSSQRLLLLAILFHRNREGLAWPSMATLGDRAGITERHARRLVGDLARDGWIVVIPGGGRARSNRYRIVEERFSTGDVNPDMDVLVTDEKLGHSEARN